MPPLADAASLANPLVAGVHQLFQIEVADNSIWQGFAKA